MRHQYKERNHLEEKERKKLVQQMVEGRKAVKQARMRLQKCKHQIGISNIEFVGVAKRQFFSLNPTH